MIGPVYEKLAAGYATIACVKADGDACRGAAAAAGIRAFPTFIAYVDGAEVERLEGADASKLDALMKSVAAKVAVPAAGKGAARHPSPAVAAALAAPDAREDVARVIAARLALPDAPPVGSA
jgi:thioredoxin-like negative regulator of GroEL